VSNAVWCRSAVRRVSDLVQGYEMFAQDFTRQAAETRLQWIDRAAADFFDRYLQPHETDLNSVRDRIAEQGQELQGATDRIADGEESERVLFQHSELAASFGNTAEAETGTAHRYADASINAASQSRRRSDEAKSLLRGL
jgi:hypothetical protein